MIEWMLEILQSGGVSSVMQQLREIFWRKQMNVLMLISQGHSAVEVLFIKGNDGLAATLHMTSRLILRRLSQPGRTENGVASLSV